jgi:soluble epoxide hydrolase/lipid-phosphate phosphatase
MSHDNIDDDIVFLSTLNIQLHVIKTNPTQWNGHTLVMCHGFPDYSFGWRKQIEPLTDAGYQLLIPDLPGYGQTKFTDETVSKQLESYSYKFVTSVLAKMLEHYNIKKAIFVGHDWGGEVVYRMCLFHPDCVLAVAALCTPYIPRHSVFIPLEQIVKKLPLLNYQLYFCNHYEDACRELEENTTAFFIALMRSHKDFGKGRMYEDGRSLLSTMNTTQLSSLISEKELEQYVNTFSKSGFGGPLNWYKTRKINWGNEEGLDPIIKHPALMITAGRDAVLPPSMSRNMENFMPNLKRGHIERSAHWMQVEQPDLVNKIFLEWLNTIENNPILISKM